MARTARRGVLGRVRRLLGQVGFGRLMLTLALIAAALATARSSWDLPLLGDAERGLYDLRFSQLAPQLTGADQRITLVTYQDSTLINLKKRSPLDRRTLAQALRAIDAIGPKAIGIDILLDQEQDEDGELVEALNAMQTPTYIAFATVASNPSQMEPAQEEYLRGLLARVTNPNVHPASVRFLPDPADGVMRRWPQRLRSLAPFLPDLMAAPDHIQLVGYRGAIRFQRPASENPDDAQGAFPELEISTFAAAGNSDLPPEAREALLAAPELRDLIAGRYVLIGGNIRLLDDFETPTTRFNGYQTKGIAIHAQMLRQALDDEAPARLSWLVLWLAAILVVAAGAATGLLELRSLGLVVALFVQLGLIAALPFLLHWQGVDTLTLPAAGWAAGWLLAYIGSDIAARAVGSEQRRFAHSALGRYLPSDVANEIMRDPDRLNLTGEKKQIFALFTDLEGFTKLSHAIPPEQLSALLNRYLDMLSDTVLEHGGTIDKFVGDAVVAFWGAPIARPDDGARAIRAAIAMYQCGEAFRASAGADLPAIGHTRVGLHRGEAVVGNFGGDKRIQYTALGDGMNTAARLESANKALQTTMLASREALEGEDPEAFRPMGRVLLSGRSTPVEVWEPAPDMTSETRATLRALWTRYDGGDREALADIAAIATAAGDEDPALRSFVHRIREAGPGGTFVLGSK